MYRAALIAGFSLGAIFVAPGLAQLGSVGTVRDTGGPLREYSQSLSDSSGSVRESVQFGASGLRRPLSGLPVSAGSRGVYGSGSVRDGSAGSVADISRTANVPLAIWELPMVPTGSDTLHGLEGSIRNLQPSDGEEFSPETSADHIAESVPSEASSTFHLQPKAQGEESVGSFARDDSVNADSDDASELSREGPRQQTLGPDEDELVLGGEPTQ